MKYLRVTKSNHASVTIKREAIKKQKLVYIMCANKAVKYGRGKSKIVYIGQTHFGIKRLMGSAAERSDFLETHSIKELNVYIVTCKPRRNLDTPKKLESALLYSFHDMFDSKPKLNKQDANKRPTCFKREKIDEIINFYS